MSWSIPTKIEEDFISGKAQYRTFQTGVGGQSILPVPTNAYAVIFGYDFSPAGGGFKRLSFQNSVFSVGATSVLNDSVVRFFETQQISFYTGTDFYPFIHHVDVKSNALISGITNQPEPEPNSVLSDQIIEEIDSTPISRQVYITSDKDISIAVGLVLNTPVQINSAIPQTNRTPALLSYGGSGQLIAIQTDLGPAANPVEFVQPSPKDFEAFSIPAVFPNVSGQAFATPDPTNGLLDPSVYLTSLGDPFRNAAACNYFLNLHYALYTESVPEQRG
jgi:hypothetical protein